MPFLKDVDPISAHGIYLGYVKIDHTNGGEVARIGIKVFQDDLENALKNAFENFRFSNSDHLCQVSETQMQQYFSRHLELTINGSKQLLMLQQCSRKNDLVLLSFEMNCPEDWRRLNISADFFTELFPTQSNVFQVIHGNEKRYFRLNNQQQNKEFSF